MFEGQLSVLIIRNKLLAMGLILDTLVEIIHIMENVSLVDMFKGLSKLTCILRDWHYKKY